LDCKKEAKSKLQKLISFSSVAGCQRKEQIRNIKIKEEFNIFKGI
jgi:hypothetical protein